MPDPYTQLLEWRRSESSGRGLSKLPKDFYESTRRYLAETRQTFESELRENPSSKKGELARQTYQRAHQIARDIVEARMTKILSQAFQATVGGSRDLPNALGEERNLFDTLAAQLRAHRQSVAPFLELFGGVPPVGPAEPAGATPPATAVPATKPAAEPAPRSAGTSVYVRVLKDGRPLAIGQETVEIRKEDVLSLPPETAKILVAAGLAEPLVTSAPSSTT